MGRLYQFSDNSWGHFTIWIGNFCSVHWPFRTTHYCSIVRELYSNCFLTFFLHLNSIGLAWTQAFYWSQLIVTKFIFIQKAYPDSEHQVLNNRYSCSKTIKIRLLQFLSLLFLLYRRLMHWFAFFCLFQNAFVGLFSTLIRIIKSFAVNLLTFSRLDKVLFIKGLESFDSGKCMNTSTKYCN